jgi:ubiquinone/menaquinone biosynthesis C-methylase UbiE
MNYKRIYDYRFQHVSTAKKKIVWDEVSDWLFHKQLDQPQKILDPAGGMCEFINAVPASEKWTIDIEEDFVKKYANKDVVVKVGNNLEMPLPENYFDAVFISNFLEHLNSQEEVARLLEKMNKALRTGGRIVIIGPNFKYCYRDYFDFADHTVILSELGVAEHLAGAGFSIVKIIPQFLPLSFRSGSFLPVTTLTIKMYLNFPLAWKFFGKQFLLVAEKEN